MFHPNLGNEVVEGAIVIDRYALHFRSENLVEEIPVARMEVECADEDGKIYFKDSDRPGLSIYTLDQSVLDYPAVPKLNQLRADLGEAAGRRELSRRLRITVYFLIACVGVTWLCSLATGVMVRSLVARVPVEWEEKFGRMKVEEMSGGPGPANYSNQVAQLDALAAPLLKAVPLRKTKVEFHIVEDAEPNAFALPGGYVMVNTGLLALTERPEELLGVLAHELAHVTQRHLERKIISAAGPLLIFGVFFHSRDSLLDVLGKGSGLMVLQGFSKEFETEADEVGWQYLVAANIDPRGMTSMFRKLKAYEESQSHHGSVPQAFQSHPLLEKRIARLEAKWKKLSRQSGFIEITNTIPLPGPDDSAPKPPANNRPH